MLAPALKPVVAFMRWDRRICATPPVVGQIMTEAALTPKNVSLRSVALPAEHGGWGFLVEPILLGMLTAGSWYGLLLAVASFGVFLVHQPLKIALKDRLKGRRPARTVLAERFVLLYGLMTVVPLAVLLLAAPAAFLFPIALAVPLAAVQLVYDSRNQSRRLLPEISGALSLAMIAPSIALLAGWELVPAFVLWGIIGARVIPSILYVRERLRVEHGKPESSLPAWIAHSAALLTVSGLAAASLTPWPGIFAFVILLVRALVGLSAYRTPRPAKVIGFQEVAYGLVTVLLVSLGYRAAL